MDVGTVYRKLVDFFPMGPLMRRVCMLKSMTWALRGILHNLVCGHHHPFKTAYSDTVIVEVRT